MNRKVLVTLLWKEIRDLEEITEGFLIMTEYPEEIVQLVIEKTESIQSYIQQLGQFKSELTDFNIVETSTVATPIEQPKTEEEHSNVEVEVLEESVDISKAPSFIVTSNQEVSIDDHFVEIEEELYLNQAEAEEVLETVIETAVESTETLQIEPQPVVVEPVVVEPVVVEEIALIVENVQETILEPEQVAVEEESVTPVVEIQADLFDAIVEPVQELPREEVVAIEQVHPVIEVASQVEEKVTEVPLEVVAPKVESTQKITDIKQSMSLGDRFRFQRDLFKGNGEDMNKTIKYINQLSTVNEAISFLEKKYKWDADDESAVDFYQIVKRRFL
jgi:hypothetical protein